MSDQLLTIKLFPPPRRPRLVERPRLLQKLNEGLSQGHRLTLVSAPAGYGKTTLVVDWLQTLDRPFAWLSLDRGDNQLLQFLVYLAAAFQQVDTTIGSSFQAFIETNGRKQASPEALQAQLPALVNEIAEAHRHFLLVLDDFHTLTDLGIHEALGFLLDHQPTQMHLVIITRQDPLLRLSRHRSQGLVTEIRLGELRFTAEEAASFLNETMKLFLAPELVAALETRTEGWIAGLQLAAISLSEAASGDQIDLEGARRVEFIRTFAGDDRHVMDYLMDEVLSRQPEAVQQFLLCTSILERFSGPLCDALLERGDRSLGSGTPVFSSAQDILEYLEKYNLFLIPLDNRRQWYRYHHLFAELLINRLQATRREQVAGLHCRASQWFEAAGMTADAVDHALLAEDFDRALGLIEHTAGTSIWASGDLPVLLNWSNRLPLEVIRNRPRLCLYNARALFFAGQVDAAEEYLQFAAQALEARSPSDPTSRELWGVLYTNQATFAAMRAETQSALDLAQQALPLLPEGDLSSRARVYHAIGMAEYYNGKVHEAELAFTQAIYLCRLAGNRNLGLDVSACLALTLILAGHPRRAMQACEEALAADEASRQSPAASTIYIAQAEILMALNDLPAALEKMEIGIELARQLNWTHVLWRGYAMLSAIQIGLGDIAGMRETLPQLELLTRRYTLPPVGRFVDAWRVRIDLSQGELASVVRWAEARQYSDRQGTLAEFEDLTLVRVWLAQGKASDALALLNARLPLAESEGRGYDVVEMLTLRAITLKALGDSNAALEDLTRALALAEPEGLLRVFLDRAEPLIDMLKQIRRTKKDRQAANHAGRVLACVEEPDFRQSALQPAGQAATALAEPLSDRELDVLRLIAEGLSNPEIAARLFLSVNTLHAHTSNIYGKLDVHNRVQAVDKARELGLLPR